MAFFRPPVFFAAVAAVDFVDVVDFFDAVDFLAAVDFFEAVDFEVLFAADFLVAVEVLLVFADFVLPVAERLSAVCFSSASAAVSAVDFDAVVGTVTFRLDT